MTDLTQILSGIVSLLLAVLTAFVIPYIKEKYGAAKTQKIYSIVAIAVEAAEMLFQGTGLGEKKKAYVMQYLTDHGYTVDTETLNVMIESAVLNLKQAVEK